VRLLSRPCSCLIPSSCRVFVVVAASKGGAGAPGRVLDDDRGLLVSGAGALLDRDRRDLRYVYVIDEVASSCTSSVRAHSPGETRRAPPPGGAAPRRYSRPTRRGVATGS
jgi:hypothetical protein